MKNSYYLPGLSGDNKYHPLIHQINEKDTPMIYLFATDIDTFYQKHCRSLDTFKLREKRLLDFETPNRALITHEYDIIINESFDYSKFYYLFNPTKRLSWLKIYQDEKRLCIAKETDIKNYIHDILRKELARSPILFEDLWKGKKGFPCFIKLEDSKDNNFLLTASYYDSIKKIGKEKISIWNPIMERCIQYDYLPLINKSSWLYVKSPKNFNVRYNHKKFINPSKLNIIDIVKTDRSEEADPEKISLTIINKGSNGTKNDTVTFSMEIYIPTSLKIWFLCIYYLSMITMALLLTAALNELWLLLFNPISDYKKLINILFDETNFGDIIIWLVAAIITTRSWLITEETITKYYSIFITTIMIVVIILYFIIMIIF